MTVQELIDELNKVEDKNRECVRLTYDGLYNIVPLTKIRVTEADTEGLYLVVG